MENPCFKCKPPFGCDGCSKQLEFRSYTRGYMDCFKKLVKDFEEKRPAESPAQIL